ncbi:hypothetical protein [Novosphingobium cyanobacteriorum]|uniref:Uncharacterized protein n=1 Tax=Novosphingobium cyanobacteriorum TaxID=3024215 RepID=A0ABT6CNR8_9SPHN|nr:hypothetical protein [Novosphingobium cyanobacteriorum]MDF8335555.1 hypothetical protein [Novosphingobium cyanobacteriorum]
MQGTTDPGSGTVAIADIGIDLGSVPEIALVGESLDYGCQAPGAELRAADTAAHVGHSTKHYYATPGKRGRIEIVDGYNGGAAIPRPWLDAVNAARALLRVAA